MGSFRKCSMFRQSIPLNKLLVYIDAKLASVTPESQTKFDNYVNSDQTFMGEANLIDHESRGLSPNKSPGYDSISSNVVKEISDMFFTPLEYIFRVFFATENISRKLKNCESVPDLQESRRLFTEKSQTNISSSV